MKLLIDVEKDYYEMIKYNVEHGQEYKPFEIIANGIPYEEGPQGELAERALAIIDRLRTDGHINNKEQGTLRRAILLPERPQGEWKEDAFSIICPFCDMSIEDEVRWLYPDDFDLNFCPNCGKKLRWKGEE